mmetsp:Transcript_19316/g.58030  ORF Transcript_19316/g.58030 Transcript_19316/m.58030 type:complete len:333 (-) Transcript_19316:74-1072(-)
MERLPLHRRALMGVFSPPMRIAALLAAAEVASAEPWSGGPNRQELLQEFDFGGWAQHALQQTGGGVLQATRQVTQTSKQVGSALGKLESQAANASGQLGNLSAVLLGGATEEGKAVAFSAVLAYLGTCREYFALLPDIPPAVAPGLAKTLQGIVGDPSRSSQDCEAAVKEGMDAEVSARMKGRKGEEQMAIGWLAADRAHILCGEKLMKALELFEAIRLKYPEQYKEALHDKLLLEVVTEEVVAEELDRVCGHKGGWRKNDMRLFTESGDARVPAAAAELASVRLHTAALALLAGASLLAVGIAWRRHRLQRGHRRPADASVAELSVAEAVE